MRTHLKEFAKDHDLANVRVVESTCLDVCPKKGVTVARVDDASRAVVAQAKTSPEDIFRALGLLDKLSAAS